MSVAMTVDKLKREIKLDDSYKYIRQVVDGSVKIAKFVGSLAVLNGLVPHQILSKLGQIVEFVTKTHRPRQNCQVWVF